MAFKVQAQIFVHGSISITPALHQGMEHDTKLMHGTARHVTSQPLLLAFLDLISNFQENGINVNDERASHSGGLRFDFGQYSEGVQLLPLLPVLYRRASANRARSSSNRSG
jgi:hypothetical protein